MTDRARRPGGGGLLGLPPEEQRAAVKALMAEAGYPDAVVMFSGRRDACLVAVHPEHAPEDVTWRALALAYPSMTLCWPCWQGDHMNHACDHDLWAGAPPARERKAS